jgi:phage shock protein C
MAETRRLTRSEDDRMVAGVCGGLAEFLGVDATLVRIAFVLLAVFGGSGILLYGVLWLIVPRSASVGTSPRDVLRDNLDEGREMVGEGSQAVRRAYQRWRAPEDASSPGTTGPDAAPPPPSAPYEPGLSTTPPTSSPVVPEPGTPTSTPPGSQDRPTG